MILLPRGNPVKEKVNPGKVNLPEALDKLRQGKFSGYLRFDFPVATGIFVFEMGRFVDALFESSHDSLLASNALARIFSESLKGAASLSIYRLSPELALHLHAVLHGELLHQGQELELINVRGLLKRLRAEQLNGCLRVYGGSQVALVFYRDGHPLGFFHDGAMELETTADCSRSVAREAGAKIDVLATQLPDGHSLADLWDTENLGELWQAAHSAQFAGGGAAPVAERVSSGRSEAECRTLLLGWLRKVAQQYLGAFGVSLVEKEFVGFARGPLEECRLTGMYANLAQAAELVIEKEQVEQMLAEMQRGVRPLFASQ